LQRCIDSILAQSFTDFECILVNDGSSDKSPEICDEYAKTYATIPEWVYLLGHAEYVISNSYHCTIFSLFFGEIFGVIPLWGKNTRFDSIFQLFGIENRFMNLDFSIMDKDIDWQSVSDTFLNIRNDCRLSEIISGKDG